MSNTKKKLMCWTSFEFYTCINSDWRHEESVIQTSFHLKRPRPVLCCIPSRVFRPALCGTNALATGHMEPMPCTEEPVGSSTSIPVIASLAWPCLYQNMHSKVSKEYNSISIVEIKKNCLLVLLDNPLIAGMT